ncbi:MAG TPA: GNAT family N-acetyltransferase [Methanomassiliicoccales archaeon]|nr:GNAT family N-acetyltransferase [Methanomassiliicoccales archaeon]
MGFRLVHAVDDSQIDDLVDMYRGTYWAAHRSREDIVAMLRGTDYVFGVVEEETGRLRAFARVLSDNVFRAVLFDVMAHPDFRGQGLVRMIFEDIAAHPVLGSIEQLVLYCTEDVVKLYEKWGFTQDLGGTRIMMRKGPMRR